ncbi:cation-transporting P-type ATPase, partial [Candidatus Peregrinibacteria bacterium]|nr:cation-transporting P-type ATPase [Candidatus Peregrinibacteria bacterium]
MPEGLIIKIITLFFASFPLSLLFLPKGEKLGKTTTICTDIKNILTKNELMVRTLYFDKYKVDFEHKENIARIKDTENLNSSTMDKTTLKTDQGINLINTVIALCHYEKLKRIELTIINFLLTIGANPQKAEKEYEIITKFAPQPDKKISTTVAVNKTTREIFTFSKGNPKKLLEKCAKLFINGKKIEMTHHYRRKIRKNLQHIGKNGQKAIAFAYKALPLKKLDVYTESFAEREMTFLGIMGITEPLNLIAEESIKQAKEMGIKIYILTNEKEKKAIAIGKQLNIINPHYFETMTGPYLSQIGEQKLDKILENKNKDYIFAELSDENKNMILEKLNKTGEKTIYITRENKVTFREIVEIIKSNKTTEKNRDKFLEHAISCKIAEFIVVLLSITMISVPISLTIPTIIILDILVNLPLELAIRKEDTIQKFSSNKTRILLKGLFLGAIISGLYVWSIMRNGWEIFGTLAPENYNQTIVFASIVGIQILNAINIINPQKTLFRKTFFSHVYILLTSIIVGLITY